MLPIRPVLALSLAAALVLSSCGGDDNSTDDEVIVNPTINVGRTPEPISQLMAEIYSQGLENAGYRVGRKDPVADQATAIAGLEAGNVQLISDFSGTLLSYLAANGGTGSDAVAVEDQMTALREQLPDTLTVFEPAPVDNGIVVACGAAAVEELTLAKISDLADADITLGATTEFGDSATGLAALNTAYETELTITPVDDVAAAVVDGTVDCGALPALTPSMVVDGLIMLEDDKTFAAANALVPLMTLTAGQPDVQAVLDAINVRLSTDVMRSLLVKLDTGEESYDAIAKQFLASIATEQ